MNPMYLSSPTDMVMPGMPSTAPSQGGLGGLGGMFANMDPKQMFWLQLGANILANNTGHGGAFAPAIGKGLQQTLQAKMQQMQRDQEAAWRRKRFEADEKYRAASLAETRTGREERAALERERMGMLSDRYDQDAIARVGREQRSRKEADRREQRYLQEGKRRDDAAMKRLEVEMQGRKDIAGMRNQYGGYGFGAPGTPGAPVAPSGQFGEAMKKLLGGQPGSGSGAVPDKKSYPGYGGSLASLVFGPQLGSVVNNGFGRIGASLAPSPGEQMNYLNEAAEKEIKSLGLQPYFASNKEAIAFYGKFPKEKDLTSYIAKKRGGLAGLDPVVFDWIDRLYK